MGRLPRVVFFGTWGEFSPEPLAALLAAGIPVAAVVVPARAPDAARWEPVSAPCADLPVLTGGSLPDVRQLARDHCIPLLAVARPLDAIGELEPLRPDLLCVACFPWRLPRSLLRLAQEGGLNVHPSLLPAYRGPAPLFWQFRAGERSGGVTIHWLDEGLDTGDIAAQASLAIPERITGAQFESRCARLGGRLLVEALQARGPGGTLRRPQDEAAASYHSWPRAADFRIPTEWPARRAFNFARAAASWGVPCIVAAGREFPVRRAIRYSPTARLESAYHLRGDRVEVQFSPGVLIAHVG